MRNRLVIIVAAMVFSLSSPVMAQVRTPPGLTRLDAQNAIINPDRVEIVDQKLFIKNKGISLKPHAKSHLGLTNKKSDLLFNLQVPNAGFYWIYAHSATDVKGRKLMRSGKDKNDSLRLMIAIDSNRPVQRVLFTPWNRTESSKQKLGIFELSGEKQKIHLWLPEGVRLDYIEFIAYNPPKPPQSAVKYQPPVIPPSSHPRIWVTKKSLPTVRENLEKGENKLLWKRVKKIARKPFQFVSDPNVAVGMNSDLLNAAAAKAFVYLMTNDVNQGQEAIRLINSYISVVEFDNILDVSRDIGKVIYSAALVYDWCYTLMSKQDRTIILDNFMRLAEGMEIGWPPFRQPIVNGHGSEAQVNRDLLSMAIAIYDENPMPYRYCAYRILEELVPMRRFEYQSPRHSQGGSYGPHRFKWDMHAAWLFYRMADKKIFDDNIKNVYKGWLYQLLPNDQIFQDGDMGQGNKTRENNLDKTTTFLSYTYNHDPTIKYKFIEQGALLQDPILQLLLNDPDIKATQNYDALPLSINYGPIIGGMIARTGWDFGGKSDNVVVEMKGGGYQFGNHQHSDAGSFQIYYRGMQAGDIGGYKYYATPYDYNFNKRSIAHSMMLVVDPNEKISHNSTNDGGTRFIRSSPSNPEQTVTDKTYANGSVVSASFGPSKQKPLFNYFSVDLTSAYSSKVENYVRSFCFLNLNNAHTPALLIILDNITTKKAIFKKYWQVNTFNMPEITNSGLTLKNSEFGMSGKARVQMLRPKASERNTQVLSGKSVYNIFGRSITPLNHSPDISRKYRVIISPINAKKNNIFLTVISMSDAEAPELPIELVELSGAFIIYVANKVVVLSKTGKLLEQDIQLKITSDHENKILITGLAEGNWRAYGLDNKLQLNTHVEKGQNTAYFKLPKGDFIISPIR